MMLYTKCVFIGSEKDVEKATMAARIVSQYCGLNTISTSMLTLAVSEIANNVVKYGGKGKCRLDCLPDRAGVSVTIIDNGPGIADVPQAMTDGFSTGISSLGCGLGAASRAVDVFEITSAAGEGVTVRLVQENKTRLKSNYPQE